MIAAPAIILPRKTFDLRRYQSVIEGELRDVFGWDRQGVLDDLSRWLGVKKRWILNYIPGTRKNNSGGGEVALPPATIADLSASSWHGSSANPQIFSGVSFGATPGAGQNRVIAIGCWNRGGSLITSASIGGVSATIAAQQLSGNEFAAIIYAVVNSGTSGTVSISMEASEDLGITPARIITSSDGVHVDAYEHLVASGTTISRTISVEEGEVVMAVGSSDGSGTWTWSSVTEISDNERGSVAIKEISAANASYTITGTYTVNDNKALAICRWR